MQTQAAHGVLIIIIKKSGLFFLQNLYTDDIVQKKFRKWPNELPAYQVEEF